MKVTRQQAKHRLQLSDEELEELQEEGVLVTEGDGFTHRSIQEHVVTSDFLVRMHGFLDDLAREFPYLSLNTQDPRPRRGENGHGSYRQFPVLNKHTGETILCTNLGDMADLAERLRTSP